MKLLSVSSSRSCADHFYQKLIWLYSTSAIPIRFSRNKSASCSLYSRISPLGNPNVPLAPVLDQWIREGNSTSKRELERVINELAAYRRFKHALEVSLWMTERRGFPLTAFDIAVRLKMIHKISDLEKVEKYMNTIPENLKTHHVYLALLNCYCIAKSVDKAESVMQKARDLEFAVVPTWYNLLMNLHCQLGNMEKVSALLSEMEEKGIPYDDFTYSVRLSASAIASDAALMDDILKTMLSDPHVTVHWRTFVTAAEGYLKMGLVAKATEILNRLEGQLKTSKDKILFTFLLKLYAEAGEKEQVYRIWNLYSDSKKLNRVYMSMMRSLMKFDDVEGMEKIFKEWEATQSSGLEYDFRIPNFLIDAYCSDGCLEKAKALIDKGKSKGGEPVVATWCHMARGHLTKDQVSEAIEAVKKAISVCPSKFQSQKDSLETCLGYLENGDSVEKAEELLSVYPRKMNC